MGGLWTPDSPSHGLFLTSVGRALYRSGHVQVVFQVPEPSQSAMTEWTPTPEDDSLVNDVLDVGESHLLPGDSRSHSSCRTERGGSQDDGHGCGG